MNPEQLIAARGVQGIGGALLVPGSLAIISASFEEGEQRDKAIGTRTGLMGILAALGPLLGGFLVANVSWQAAFLINVPVGVIVLFMVFRYVPESRDPDARKLDLPGALLVSLGLGGIVYGLIESSNRTFGDTVVLGALVLGAAALVAFVLVEWRVYESMMPLSLFRSHNFSGASLVTLLLFAGLGGVVLLAVQPDTGPRLLGDRRREHVRAVPRHQFPHGTLGGGLITRYGAKLPLVIGPTMPPWVFFSLPCQEPVVRIGRSSSLLLLC